MTPVHSEGMAGLVDIHTHAIPRGLPDMEALHPWGRWPLLVVDADEVHAEVIVGGKPYRRVDSRCWSVSRRLADMEAEGVRVQVISPMPALLCHDAPADGAVVFARAVNDRLAEMVAECPDRLAGLGMVPLQDVGAAVEELTRCVRMLGLLGVELGTRIGGLELSDPSFAPFYDAAERLGALLFVHPVDGMTDPRSGSLGLTFGAGMPTETGLAAAALLTSDVLALRPELAVCLAHGAGTLPGILGRVERGVVLADPSRPRPAELARRLMADSLTYDPDALALVLEKFGDTQVMLGTDYPFIAREVPPDRVLRDAPAAFTAERLDAVARGNAERLLARLRR